MVKLRYKCINKALVSYKQKINFKHDDNDGSYLFLIYISDVNSLKLMKGRKFWSDI